MNKVGITFIFCISYFLCIVSGYAQDERPDSLPNIPRKNYFYIEGGGSAIFGSLNYERSIYMKRKFTINARVGCLPYFADYLLTPLSINFFFGDSRNRLQLGTGTLFVYKYKPSLYTDNVRLNFLLTPLIFGYQYHTGKNLFLRANVIPWVLKGSKSFSFWGGLSVGYNFGRKKHVLRDSSKKEQRVTWGAGLILPYLPKMEHAGIEGNTAALGYGAELNYTFNFSKHWSISAALDVIKGDCFFSLPHFAYLKRGTVILTDTLKFKISTTLLALPLAFQYNTLKNGNHLYHARFGIAPSAREFLHYNAGDIKHLYSVEPAINSGELHLSIPLFGEVGIRYQRFDKTSISLNLGAFLPVNKNINVYSFETWAAYTHYNIQTKGLVSFLKLGILF